MRAFDKGQSAQRMRAAAEHSQLLFGNALHFFTNAFDILAHAVDGVAASQKYSRGNECQNQNLVHVFSLYL